MSVRRAGAAWWTLPTVAALATLLLLAWRLPARPPAPSEVAALLAETEVLQPRATAVVEKGWVDAAFPAELCYLPVPAGPAPCPAGVDGVPGEQVAAARAALSSRPAALARLEQVHRESGGWLTGLVLGRSLLAQERVADAASLYGRLSGRYGADVRRAQDAVRSGRTSAGPPTPELRVLIYVLQAAGYTQILDNRSSDDFWWTLKSPIACGKLLVARDRGLLADKVLEGFELRVPPPGCAATTPGVSSYDLYNNLLVGYLRVQGFEGTPEGRQREFHRDYRDTPEENPLQAVLSQEVATLGNAAAAVVPAPTSAVRSRAALRSTPPSEAWVWAVSNAERLVRDRRREGRGMPEHALLALTLAGLVESALARAPAPAVPGLLLQKRELVAAALARRDELPAAQRAAFDRGLARLQLAIGTRASLPAAPAPAVIASLAPEQRREAAVITDAWTARRDASSWSSAALVGPPSKLAARLSGRAGPWREALRQDLAAGLARLASGASLEEQRRLATLGHAVLAGASAQAQAPPELRALDDQLGDWRLLQLRRTRVGAWGIATLVAAAVWPLAFGTQALLWWALDQLRLWRQLFTSFYRREARARLREMQ